MELKANLVDSIIDEYHVTVDATRPAKLQTSLSKDTRIFSVENANENTYLIDTPMARAIACYPHVVGDDLEKLAYEAAERSFQPILELAGVDLSSNRSAVVFEQILRAAPGYQLHRVAEKFIPGSFRTVYVRPRYTHTSYRDHDGMVQRQLNIVYEDFSKLPRGKSISLIMQDTVASSLSAEISLEATVNQCKRAGSTIDKLIVYGFISLEGLKLLETLVKRHGITLIAFAMGNLTALCANKYDMPLYGVDEWLWQRTRTINKLGGLADRLTFDEYLKQFIPGADQPGDWSARQSRLFTGNDYEDGDIAHHIENSVRLIKSLLTIGTLADWQIELANKELNALQEELPRWKNRETKPHSA